MNLVLPLLPTARQLLSAAFAMFKLFGFIPFAFDCYTFKLKSTNATETLLHLPVFQFIFYATLNWITLLYRVEIFYTDLQILSVNDILKYGSLLMAVFVMLIFTVIQRNTHRSVWDMLDLIRDTARKKFVQSFTRHYLWKFYGYLVFSAFIETLVLQAVNESPSDLAYWLIILILHAFLRLHHLFHMCFIDILKIHLQQLHYGLVEIGEYIGDLHAHPHNSDTYRESYQRCIDRLLELKSLYGQLWELSDRINRTFGWSQICNFTGNFVQLSCDLYWCYVSAKFYNTYGGQEIFITLLPTGLLIGLLLNSAESCLRVASSLQSALLEIPLENDSTFRKIIYRFGLQIAQQRIRLTANGLFEINYSLLKMSLNTELGWTIELSEGASRYGGIRSDGQICDHLHTLMNAFARIERLVGLLNRAFGYSFAIIKLINHIYILTDTYWIVQGFISGTVLNSLYLEGCISSKFICLMMNLYSNERILSECHRTQVLLHRINLRWQLRCKAGWDRVQHFLLKLESSEPFAMTAISMFRMDYVIMMQVWIYQGVTVSDLFANGSVLLKLSTDEFVDGSSFGINCMKMTMYVVMAAAICK
uniref:Gustatory receptor n=1 Tax=Anopheles maculatus TaxID=74869 RepID=A0A182SIU2_9DIPT